MRHELPFRLLSDTELAEQITRLQRRIQALRLGETTAATLTRQGFLNALAEAEREQARRST